MNTVVEVNRLNIKHLFFSFLIRDRDGICVKFDDKSEMTNFYLFLTTNVCISQALIRIISNPTKNQSAAGSYLRNKHA